MLLLFGCSTKKNALINRKYHAIITEYNILYNGNIAFQKGLDEINELYEDNYWEVLPIEPIKLAKEQLEIPDYKKKEKESKNKEGEEEEEEENLTFFELAEEKAVKAVQKHSMKIGGKERNSKIDKAFLLLGKSRYYTSRFVPAIEAFNYVIKNYPEADLIDQTIIWKSKTSIRMRNEIVAIEELELYLENDKIEEKNLEDAYITMALAYKQMDSTEVVIKHLHKAVELSVDPVKKSRNLFILGQLYRQEDNLNNSQIAFQEIIDFKRAPYKYKVRAEIEKVKNFQLGEVPKEAISQLEKLIEIRENRPYLGELYYHLALLQNQRGEKEIALINFQNSVHAKQSKKFQKGLSYEASGDIYFQSTDYFLASSYYDSVLQVSGDLDTKRIRKLRRKKQGLESVLVFEEVIQRNDSIWNILSMDKNEQTIHFENYIEELKIKDKEAKQKAKFLEDLRKYEEFGFASARTTVNSSGSKGQWYFYNDQSVSFGIQDFKRIWGSRKLADNWRWSDKIEIRNEEKEDETVQEKEVEEEVRKEYQVAYYLDQLPTTLRGIDSVSNLRNSTYYKLGLIYKEQFQEYELAATTLETLIEILPDDKLVLGTNYHLFRIFEAMGNVVKADYYSSVVVRKFPNSVFAQKILNPDKLVDNSSDMTPEGRYREIYNMYKSEDYLKTINNISKALRTFEGMPIVPKLELLKAYALAKTEGEKAFWDALDYIVLNYSNTAEGKKAKELMVKLK
ncbi:tetratricopeptide repeat protein [Flavicella sp.]|uniref:type IX secretion system periplasmic lipoprotein PorW/SprE n=1 Tax=Flavicella sp. TaxID=2957742 RepID=UPI003015EF8D